MWQYLKSRNTYMIASCNLVWLSTAKKKKTFIKSFTFVLYTVVNEVVSHFFYYEKYDLVENIPDSSMYPSLLDASIQEFCNR
jgi:hypothetical protein